MVPTDDATSRRGARAAVLALHHAQQVLRQHPEAPMLCRTALRRCVEAVTAATAAAPLVLALRHGAVQVGGETLLCFAPGDVPFGVLRAAGIGELWLDRDLPAPAVAALVQRLAAVRVGDDPERCIARFHDDPELRSVRLHAVAAEPGSATAGEAWWLLPGPAPGAAALQPLVARDLGTNLTALAAQQCLDDLETGSHGEAGAPSRPQRTPLAPLLVPLFARMLDDADLPTAAWLLAAIEHHAAVPAATRDALRDAALARADDGWLRARLDGGTRDELLALAGLAMHLGHAFAGRFADLAVEVHHPLARWLCDLVGQGELRR